MSLFESVGGGESEVGACFEGESAGFRIDDLDRVGQFSDPRIGGEAPGFGGGIVVRLWDSDDCVDAVVRGDARDVNVF